MFNGAGTSSTMGGVVRAETIINGWSQWNAGMDEKPEIIRPLPGGRSNRSYLLKSADKYLVLRLNGAETLLPRNNRHAETAIWQAASAAGLAPALLYADEQRGVLISTYIEDSLPSRPERHGSIIEHALKLIQDCHQLEVAADDIDYSAHIQHYWQLIEARGGRANPNLLRQRSAMQDLLASLHDKAGRRALCHHDPVISNFVGSEERLYLIDWEYAANGLVVMDYAALGVEWGIDDGLLVAKSGIEAASLATAKELYTYMCALWLEIKTNP